MTWLKLCPHSDSLPTASNNADNATATYYASCVIGSHTPEQVWAAILDFASYPLWNAFTPSLELSSPPPAAGVTGTSSVQAGQLYDMQYRFSLEDATQLCPVRIMTVDTERRHLCWLGCPRFVPSWLIRGEKVQQVSLTPEGKTLYEIWETQSGPMARVVRWKFGDGLDRMMTGTASGLKEYLGKK